MRNSSLTPCNRPARHGLGNPRSEHGLDRLSQYCYPDGPSTRTPPRAARRLLVAAGILVGIALLAIVASVAVQAIARQASLPSDTTADTQAARTPAAANVDPSQTGSGEPATSTPVAQWRKGTMPHLYQTDPAWADKPYAGATVRESGCGPTCMTMVYVYLTGKTDYDPASMCAFSERNGFVDQGMTAWLFMSEGARMLGLTSEELPADASTVSSVLAAGLPVICSMGPGDFTKLGHFIVLCGLDADGRAIVYDPNSAERSAMTWDVQTVIDQCRNLWAFSAA